MVSFVSPLFGANPARPAKLEKRMADLGIYEGKDGFRFKTDLEEPFIDTEHKGLLTCNFWVFDQYNEATWNPKTGESEEGDQICLNHEQAKKLMKVLMDYYGKKLE